MILQTQRQSGCAARGDFIDLGHFMGPLHELLTPLRCVPYQLAGHACASKAFLMQRLRPTSVRRPALGSACRDSSLEKKGAAILRCSGGDMQVHRHRA